MKPTRTVFFSLLILTISSTIYFAVKSSRLNKELNSVLVNQEEIKEEPQDHYQLMKIDSMLLTSSYINSYEESLKVKRENKMTVPLRIALVEQLLKDDENKTERKTITTRERDSLATPKINVVAELKETDSLNFALKKAKVQLARMRQQLKQKSYGEYLKFKNPKGSQMHYVGQIKNGKANGYGIALLNTGGRYQGEWKDNHRHGEGTYHWPDGEYYVGTYTNDKRNGFGTYYWPNGEKYAGQWREDKRNGSGKFYGTNGDIVTSGEWKNDKLVNTDKKNGR